MKTLNIHWPCIGLFAAVLIGVAGCQPHMTLRDTDGKIVISTRDATLWSSAGPEVTWDRMLYRGVKGRESTFYRGQYSSMYRTTWGNDKLVLLFEISGILGATQDYDVYVYDEHHSLIRSGELRFTHPYHVPLALVEVRESETSVANASDGNPWKLAVIAVPYEAVLSEEDFAPLPTNSDDSSDMYIITSVQWDGSPHEPFSLGPEDDEQWEYRTAEPNWPIGSNGLVFNY